MRILSWNINGIRTLPQYHPWNTFKTCEGVLDELHADIICFQEMKSSRSALSRDAAVPESYQSFFSFPSNKGGYSGVGIYVDTRKVLPLKAEEGLSGKLQPKVPLSADERVSHEYPALHNIHQYHDDEGNMPTVEALDAEGRALVLDFGLFILINVYCPNETDDARLVFKMNYHLMLEERVRILIEDEHREVIVCGDLNICATPMDHPEGHLPSFVSTFYEHPARKWFHKWLDPEGPMVDIVRSYWPNRRGLYTCWPLKLSGRESNYGSRVDYFLVTRGLLPWIKHGDIQPSLKGSDHCPIYIDLHDEITSESGTKVLLQDAMKQNEAPREAPRIAAKHWEEYSGKQTILSSFFGKRKQTTEGSSSQPSARPNPDGDAVITGQDTSRPKSSVPSKAGPPSVATHVPSDGAPAAHTARPNVLTGQKRKLTTKSPKDPQKKRKSERRQATIATFFKKPSASNPNTHEVIDLVDTESDDDKAPLSSSQGASSEVLDQLDADYRFACELSAADEMSSASLAGPSSSPSSSALTSSQSKASWSNLFAPLKPPNCLVHREPTKLWTVNKPGPNKGKTFFLCSRPVGPGYDKGREQRLREEVNKEYRCNYFKWASEVKMESLRKQSKPAKHAGKPP